MPVTLHDREQAFEAKFAHDQEMRFRILARGDKLFARWAADRLGAATEALVQEVLAIPNGREHDAALLRHVGKRLDADNAGVPEQHLRTALEACRQKASRQLTEGAPVQSDLT